MALNRRWVADLPQRPPGLRRLELHGGAPSHGPDFINFVIGKSELLPLARTDLTADPTLKQNPGY